MFDDFRFSIVNAVDRSCVVVIYNNIMYIQGRGVVLVHVK